MKKEMEELTGLKAYIGNDANVAALGEMWKGGGAGEKNMIMVTLGTGVGGGVIIDGKMLVGNNGAGGEIGHMKRTIDVAVGIKGVWNSMRLLRELSAWQNKN